MQVSRTNPRPSPRVAVLEDAPRVSASTLSPERAQQERETALMAQFRDSGDEQSFRRLYEEAADGLLAWIRASVRNRAGFLDPLDVLQDTFVSIFRYAGSFRDEQPRSFRVWSRTIALNLIRRAQRDHWRPSLQDLPEGLQEPSDQRCLPDTAASLGEQGKRMTRAYQLYLRLYLAAWEQLSERDRKALKIVEVDGASYAEACDILGVGMSNMKMIMFRARRRVRDRIQNALESLQRSVQAASN